MRQRLKILLDDEPVSDLAVTVVELENDGNQPIRPDDYLEPIQLEFASEVKVLSATAIKESRAYPAEIKDQTVTLTPVLLNVGNVLTVSILTTGKYKSPHIRTSIPGISKVGRRRVSYQQAGLALVFAFVTSYALMLTYVFDVQLPAIVEIPGAIISLTTAVIGLGGIIRLETRKRKAKRRAKGH